MRRLHVDVINGGIPGSLTQDWLDLWFRVGDRFDPDVVLVVFFLRDGTQMRSIPGFFGRIRKEITNRNRRSSLYQKSFLYRLLRDRIDQASITTSYTRRFQESFVGDWEQTREWRAAKRNLLQIRGLAERRSAVVGLVIFPMLVELNEDNPFRVICDEIEAFANDSKIPVYQPSAGLHGTVRS